jgi:hypothetical protein
MQWVEGELTRTMASLTAAAAPSAPQPTRGEAAMTWLGSLLVQEYAPSTIDTYVRILRMEDKDLRGDRRLAQFRRGLQRTLGTNPISAPPEPPLTVMRVRQRIQAAPSSIQAPLAIAWITGSRYTSIVGMRIGDVHMDAQGRIIVIIRSQKTSAPDEAAPRVVPAGTWPAQLIQPLVTSTSTAGPWGRRPHIFQRTLLKEMYLALPARLLRASAVTLLTERLGLPMAATFIGHAVRTAGARYLRGVEPAATRAAAVLVGEQSGEE